MAANNIGKKILMFGLFKSKTPTVIPKDDQGKILSVTAKGSKFIVVGQFKHPQIGWQDFRHEIRTGVVGFNWANADFRVDWE